MSGKLLSIHGNYENWVNPSGLSQQKVDSETSVAAIMQQRAIRKTHRAMLTEARCKRIRTYSGTQDILPDVWMVPSLRRVPSGIALSFFAVKTASAHGAQFHDVVR